MMTQKNRAPSSLFLTAEWRHLAILSFEIDPKVLSPLVPAGTELDDWQGRTFVSIVGFRFLDTRVFGVAVPFHCNFEEVNLRFYVRRMASDGLRRGVVFVKEIVPRIAIALTARAFYGENYVAVPMLHRIEGKTGDARGPQTVSYSWLFRGRENRIELSTHGNAREVAEGSDAEFITEHYWVTLGEEGGVQPSTAWSIRAGGFARRRQPNSIATSVRYTETNLSSS